MMAGCGCFRPLISNCTAFSAPQLCICMLYIRNYTVLKGNTSLNKGFLSTIAKQKGLGCPKEIRIFLRGVFPSCTVQVEQCRSAFSAKLQKLMDLPELPKISIFFSYYHFPCSDQRQRRLKISFFPKLFTWHKSKYMQFFENQKRALLLLYCSEILHYFKKEGSPFEIQRNGKSSRAKGFIMASILDRSGAGM